MADFSISPAVTFANALEAGALGVSSDEAVAALNVSLTIFGEGDEDLEAVINAHTQAIDQNAKQKLLSLAADLIRQRGEKLTGTLRHLQHNFIKPSLLDDPDVVMARATGMLRYSNRVVSATLDLSGAGKTSAPHKIFAAAADPGAASGDSSKTETWKARQIRNKADVVQLFSWGGRLNKSSEGLEELSDSDFRAMGISNRRHLEKLGFMVDDKGNISTGLLDEFLAIVVKEGMAYENLFVVTDGEIPSTKEKLIYNVQSLPNGDTQVYVSYTEPQNREDHCRQTETRR